MTCLCLDMACIWRLKMKFILNERKKMKGCLGHKNKIDCFSGIFRRKNAGCVFFFCSANHNHD